MIEGNNTYFHNDLLKEMCLSADDDRLAHALIISESDGSGALEFALNLANYIVSSKIQDITDDKRQSALNKANKYIHPDIHFSFPFIGPTISNDFLQQWRNALNMNIHMNITEWMMALDAENKQANINAKECNSIIQKLGFKSFESEYKVLVMWLPEYLGKEGNRLLKLIEEPPDNTIFIFVTQQIDRILNTILSRCQLIKLTSPSDDQIKERLAAENACDSETAEKISFIADGNYRIAKNLFDNNIVDFSTQLFEWLRTCYKLKPEEVVNWCDNFSTLKKEQQKYFINYTLEFFRAFIVMDAMEKDKLRFQEKELIIAEKLKKFIDLEALEKIEEFLNDSFMLIERNANVKMLFMRNSIRIHELFHAAKTA